METIAPFLLLHGVHSGLDVVLVAIDLLFIIFFAFLEMSQCLLHALHLLLSLHAFAMFTPHITSNCVENPLKTIFSTDLVLFLKFKEIGDR